MIHKHIILSVVILCVFASGCSFAPEFMRPFTVADKTKIFANTEAQDTKGQDKNNHRWWLRLKDQQFNEFVHVLLDENPSLKETAERVLQARQAIGVERSGYFPTIGADGSATRIFQPTNSFNLPGGAGGGTERVFFNNVNANVTAAWQLDLFGRIKNLTSSARAQYQAAQYDYQALTHTLIADLLNRRVAVAVYKKLRSIAQDNADNQKSIYTLTKKRYELGTGSVSLTDVYLAQSNYLSAEADIAGFEQVLADERYSLDILLGRAPGTTKFDDTAFPIMPEPQKPAICVPASLIDRRPDLRASELRIASANADIGVAVADLYPDLTLNAAIGLAGNTTNNILRSEQLAGSLLGSITARLFEGGRLRANIRIKESVVRELSAKYAGEVLQAMKDVETALKAEATLAQQLAKIQNALDASEKAERIARQRYQDGVIPLQTYLEAQQRRYVSEQNYLLKQQEKWSARINLYLALGGDWTSGSHNTTSCINEMDEKESTL